MSIVSSANNPVRSEDGPVSLEHADTSKTSSGGRKLIAQREDVPVYEPRQIRRKAGALRLLELESPQSIESAATGSFGTVAVEELVIGEDDRTVISDPLDNPWRFVCALRITAQTGREYVGTGWFIGPSTLITAGHCVYLHDQGGWPASIAVIPALNGSDEAFGRSVATRFRATEGWTKRKDTNHDYGAIQLDEPLGEQTGWFGFAGYADDQLLKNEANISGYPFDRDRASRQYFHARKVSSLSPQKLFYEIDTYGGQSGSPIWFNLPSGDRIAIGVHTTGSSSSNSGTRISADVYENFTHWLAEMETTHERSKPPYPVHAPAQGARR